MRASSLCGILISAGLLLGCADPKEPTKQFRSVVVDIQSEENVGKFAQSIRAHAQRTGALYVDSSEENQKNWDRLRPGNSERVISMAVFQKDDLKVAAGNLGRENFKPRVSFYYRTNLPEHEREAEQLLSDLRASWSVQDIREE
jgi:hypothetical protein